MRCGVWYGVWCGMTEVCERAPVLMGRVYLLPQSGAACVYLIGTMLCLTWLSRSRGHRSVLRASTRT